jgi:hypothetical protein
MLSRQLATEGEVSRMVIARYTIGLDYDKSIRIKRYRQVESEEVYNGTRLNEAMAALKKRIKADRQGME